MIQQLSLKHHAVRAKLGLPDKDAPSALEKSEEIDSPGKHLDSPAKQRKISVKDLTPKGLVALSVKTLDKRTERRSNFFFALFISGHPTELENIDLLIVASQWAGVAYIKQRQMAEGIVHLERIAILEELEEESSKVHYYDGLVLLSSALYNVGCKAEAVKHLRLATAFNPEY
ncbi:ALBINO3-like protein 2, chloroplastic [Pistacia vera]|uniref:ALBINO3-like protein 2, chloroplastic n=1 Tax=Pistacia vera TaxID=55513 RepID=UPI001263E6E1|nr:ALBINO3-like protein 2, chloroplastic [Pistacia vera]